MLALLIRKKWLNYFATMMIIFVSASRLYLGVHYPVDIFGGILMGIFLVFIYDKYIYENVQEFPFRKNCDRQSGGAIDRNIVLNDIVLCS